MSGFELPVIDKGNLKDILHLLEMFDYVTFNMSGGLLGKSKVATPFGCVNVSYNYNENDLLIGMGDKTLFNGNWQSEHKSMEPLNREDVELVVRNILMRIWEEWTVKNG